MAYSYIDQAAVTAKSDGSWASAPLVRARQNVDQLHQERAYKTGCVYPAGDPLRLCSAWPCVWGPYWVWIPERSSTCTVKIRVSKVDFETASSGANAVYLYATTGDSRGRFDVPPPVAERDWDDGSRGRLLTKTASANTWTLTPRTYGRIGWVGVWLWTCSILSEIESGTIGNFQPVGGIVLTGIGTAPTGNPPEMAIAFKHTAEGASSNERRSTGPIHQIGHYRSADAVAYCVPPVTREIMGDTASWLGDWTTYNMGVAEIEGISVQSDLGELEAPAEASFHTGERLSALTHGQLAGAVERITALRTPTWMCTPGMVTEGSNKRLWQVRDEDTGNRLTTSSWETLAACFVANEPSDSNGYRAIVSIIAMNEERAVNVDRSWPDIQIRLRAVDNSGSEIVTGTGAAGQYSLTMQRTMLTRDLFGQSYSSLSHTFYFAGQNDTSWQFRGGMTSAHEWARDIGANQWPDVQRIQHLECEIAETSITYPCRLEVQAQLVFDSVAGAYRPSTMVIGAGIASRGLDDGD